MKGRFVPALSAVFFAGLALLLAGQLASSYQLAAALSLLGGALLIVAAIRGLAGLAGVHQQLAPNLESGETLLVESHGVQVRGPLSWLYWQRGEYRARLTNRRLLLSLRVMLVVTPRDVTVAWLEPGQPRSVDRMEIAGDQVSVRLARRFGGAWRLRVPNAADWRRAVEDCHPELLR